MKLLYAAALSLVVSLAHAQKHTISGSIKDAASGENLIGANIYNTSSHQGTTANNYGFYSITLQQDSIHLRISYVGYENQVVSFLLANDTTINFSLTSGSTLKEVVISGTVEDQIQETTRMGTIDVPLEQIKAMPALLGEVDVLKVLQLLPGVQSGAEGSSGLSSARRILPSGQTTGYSKMNTIGGASFASGKGRITFPSTGAPRWSCYYQQSD